jgi:hypothetical protein
VNWQEYPEEVVDRKWRTDAARLHRVLDAQGVRPSAGPAEPGGPGPTLSRVLEHLTTAVGDAPDPAAAVTALPHEEPGEDADDDGGIAGGGQADGVVLGGGPDDDEDEDPLGNERTAALAAALSAEVAREEAAAGPVPASGVEQGGPDSALWEDGMLPLFPLQPPRTGRDLLADHVTAMVCCAAMDTAGAMPGLDWLDGPSLLVAGERAADLGPRVLALVESGDPAPLKTWLHQTGVRPEKPVRLV